jgi:serine/threonine protein kinase
LASGSSSHFNYGNYQTISLLGKGGMGEVYLAEDRRLGRRVALKLLPASFVSDEGRLRRFIQEARAASALNHPNIVTILEIGESGGAHFIAMEYIEGQTLRQRLLSSPALTREEVFDIVIQTATALEAAHNAGVIHRDLKPENLMLRPDGYVKVVDFGLAKLSEAEAAGVVATMTMPGMVMGTAQYMSPEQARGLTLDRRSDLFSLGAVLYEALTGKSPFDGETISHQIVAVLEKDPPALVNYRSDLPLDLEFMIRKALAKKPEERYATALDFANDLKQLRRRLDVEAEVARLSPPAGVPSASVRISNSITAVRPSGPAPIAPPPGFDPSMAPTMAMPVAQPSGSGPVAAPPAKEPAPTQPALAEIEKRRRRAPMVGFGLLFLGGLAVGIHFSGVGRNTLPQVIAPPPPQVNITVPTTPAEPPPAEVKPVETPQPPPSPAQQKAPSRKSAPPAPAPVMQPAPAPKPAEPIKSELPKVEPVKAEIPKEIPLPPVAAPEFPTSPGVYWSADGRRWSGVHSVQARIDKKGRKVFGVKVGEKSRALVPGAAASLRIADSKPRLFVRLPDAPADRLRLVRLFRVSDSESRELRQPSVLFESGAAPEKFDFDAAPAPAGGIFLTPRGLLPPGEYAVVDVGGKSQESDLLRFWDFGVDPARR